MEIKKVPLKEYSSLRIGGEGDLVSVGNIAEILEAVAYAKNHGKSIHVIGEGTNTYFGENLSAYFFIKNSIKGVSFEEKEDVVFVTVGAGERFDDIVSFSVEKGLWGLENLSAIPGTVGAAPVQNIGAYGAELKDVMVSLSAYDTETSNVVEISNAACSFGYRDSLFKREKNRYIIISVTLKLLHKANPILTYKPLDTLLVKENLIPKDVRTLVVTTRGLKLPSWKEYPNAGSFFKNPTVCIEQGESLKLSYPDIPLIVVGDAYKIPAAWLIEHVANMKGVRVGDVGTWPNQPLVLVNYGDTTSEDISSFIGIIVNTIKEKTGIEIEKEVNFIS